MKNKTRILHIRLSKEESDDLNRKVMISGLSKSSLIRLLIKGYEPKEKPDTKFYEVTKELYAIGNNLNQLAYKANKLNLIDKEEN
ncbi:plasmid mobilization protein, partial [uncultured Clostridium sp.]|uniref:plasmid mobilization protein n=1 Tax=uncultured Clostridium sp. TaxID=59620 RepID=UPI0025FFE44F